MAEKQQRWWITARCGEAVFGAGRERVRMLLIVLGLLGAKWRLGLVRLLHIMRLRIGTAK